MGEDEKIWRTIDLIKVSEKALKDKNITNPRLNAEMLLADSLGTGRINLYLEFEKPISKPELNIFREKMKRRLHHEPIQYILGYKEFYGLKIKVKPGVLIPRNETEILVDKALGIISQIGKPKPNILEIGTGSGCISIAIAKNCDCSITAIDNSEQAISISKENSDLLDIAGRINFLRTGFDNNIQFSKYDMIISNPPYIPLNDFELLPDEIIKYEPRSALTDESDGLSFYRKIFSVIKKEKLTNPVLLEIGDSYYNAINELLQMFSIDDFKFHVDYIGINRVLEINLIK